MILMNKYEMFSSQTQFDLESELTNNNNNKCRGHQHQQSGLGWPGNNSWVTCVLSIKRRVWRTCYCQCINMQADTQLVTINSII